jgi:hypothetical protein
MALTRVRLSGNDGQPTRRIRPKRIGERLRIPAAIPIAMLSAAEQ